MLRASLAWSSMSPWLSQLWLEPTSSSSMNRTPRSASRRAIRHCQAKPAALPASRFKPYSSRVASVSPESSLEGADLRLQRQVCRALPLVLAVEAAEQFQFHLLELVGGRQAPHVRD